MSKLISKDDFIKLFDNYDITISDSDYSRFEAYADLLCEWNEKINLTAITDPEGIAIKHFFDSVYPFTLFELTALDELHQLRAGAFQNMAICDPSFSDMSCNPVSEKRITMQQETSLSNTVCLIVKFLRHHLIEIFQFLMF